MSVEVNRKRVLKKSITVNKKWYIYLHSVRLIPRFGTCCYFVIVGRSAQSVYPMTEIESKHSESLSLVLAIDSWEVFDTHPISQWLPPFLGFTIFLQNARIQQTITKRPPTKHNSFALAQLEWWFSLDTRFFLWPTQFDRRRRREKKRFLLFVRDWFPHWETAKENPPFT